MPWIHKEKKPHECKPPQHQAKYYLPGSVWQCRKCKIRWIVGRAGVLGSRNILVKEQP